MSELSPPPGPGSLDEPYVFVSYARKDRDIVYPEVDRLERAGYRVWCDRRDIPTGREWLERILDGIRHCQCFLIFISEGSTGSDYVRQEIDEALKFHKFIISVHIEKLILPADLDRKIGSIQGLEYFSLRKSVYEENLFVALFDCIGPADSNQSAARRPIPELGLINTPTPASPESTILPKIFCFCLAIPSMLAMGLALFAALDLGFRITHKATNVIILAMATITVCFAFISAAFAAASFAVYWFYVRGKGRRYG